MSSNNKVSPEAQLDQSLDQNPPKASISGSTQVNTDASKLSNGQAKKDEGQEPSKKSSNTEKEKKIELQEADQQESEYITFNPCLICRRKIQLRTWCTVIGAIEIIMCLWIVIILLILRSFVLTSSNPPQVYSEKAELRQTNTTTRNKTKDYYPGKEQNNNNKDPVTRFFQEHDAFSLNRFQSRSDNNNKNASTKSSHDDEFLPMFYITFGGLWLFSLITGIFMLLAAARRSKVFCILHSAAAFLSAVISLYLCVLLIMSVKIAAWPFILIFGVAFVLYIYFLTCSIGLFFQIRAGLYNDEFQLEEDNIVPVDQLERDSQGNLRRKNPNTRKLSKSGNNTQGGGTAKNFFSRQWGNVKQTFQNDKKPPVNTKNKSINNNRSEWAQQRAPTSKLPQTSGPNKTNMSSKPQVHTHSAQGKEIEKSKKSDPDNQQLKPLIPNELKKNEPEYNDKSITEKGRRQSQYSKQSKGNQSKDVDFGVSHLADSDEKK